MVKSSETLGNLLAAVKLIFIICNIQKNHKTQLINEDQMELKYFAN